MAKTRTKRRGDNALGYLLALSPFFTRLALIALITFSHSVSWLAQDATKQSQLSQGVNNSAPQEPAAQISLHHNDPSQTDKAL